MTTISKAVKFACGQPAKTTKIKALKLRRQKNN